MEQGKQVIKDVHTNLQAEIEKNIARKNPKKKMKTGAPSDYEGNGQINSESVK